VSAEEIYRRALVRIADAESGQWGSIAHEALRAADDLTASSAPCDDNTVYLGGAINGCTDEEANGWRTEAKIILGEHGFDWRDPMDRDYRGRELEPGVAAEIVEGDKRDIRECGVLLFNCPKPSWGTGMEIHFGHGEGKRQQLVLPEGVAPSPWLLHHGQVYHGSVVGAVHQLIAEHGR
jgi:hypothetical protein